MINTAKSIGKLILADYGMAVILVLLCGYYAWATWGVTHAEGADAAREVLQSLPASATEGVLIVAHQGAEAPKFAAAVADELAKRNVRVIATVQGEPHDLRERLEKLAASGVKVRLIAATFEAAQWRLVQNLPDVTVVAPREYTGAISLSRPNLLAIADRVAVIAIIGIGMTMVILTGGIDLSVGSLIALCAVVVARLIRDHAGGTHAGPTGMVVASAAGVAICALAGLFNGVMITAFRMPPFIVTLATMLIASGLAYELSAGQSINEVPASYVGLGRGRGPFGLPNTVWLMIALYAVAQVVMSRMVVGRYVYAIGGNREGAFYAAVPVKRMIVLVYTACATLAGVGGVVVTSQLQSGGPNYGELVELSVIAAVVVGGASLTGGRGTIFGTLIGALIIAVIGNGMNLTKVGPYRQKVVLGCVILGAVLIDRLRDRLRGKREWG